MSVNLKTIGDFSYLENMLHKINYNKFYNLHVRGICQIKVEYIHSGSQQKLRSKNWQILKFRSDNQLLKALTNLIILLYDLHFVLNFEVFQLPQHNVHFAKNLTCDNL